MPESSELVKSVTDEQITSNHISKIEKQMKKDCVKKGTLLEITLFEGAEYDNGETAGGWGEYEGNRQYHLPFPRERMSRNPGQKILGPVIEIGDIALRLNVLGNLRINYNVIHSYSVLTYKNKKD